MRRRRLLMIAGAALLARPLAARAQRSAKIARIGFLWDSPSVFPDALDAFRQGLRDLGYVDGRNIAIEYRWAEGKPEKIQEFAEELVRLKVDVIIAPSSIYTRAAKRATSAIPIIFLSHADPIGTGHVASLARPGGNATGFTIVMTETNVKGLEMFKQAVPGLERIAVIFDPATPSHAPSLKAVEAAGPLLGLRVIPVPVRSATEYEGAFATIVAERAGGVLILSTPLYTAGAKQLADLGLKHNLPSLYAPKQHVWVGGLMSYGPDRADLYRRGATYVDKILKGANPAELPVQQPTRFELVINLQTAKAIGLTIPLGFLARADEVIE
jgi:putative ABC transport system substrate-binding protein